MAGQEVQGDGKPAVMLLHNTAEADVAMVVGIVFLIGIIIAARGKK